MSSCQKALSSLEGKEFWQLNSVDLLMSAVLKMASPPISLSKLFLCKPLSIGDVCSNIQVSSRNMM